MIIHQNQIMEIVNAVAGGIMIETAEEFIKLRTSSKSEEYLRAGREEASNEVWLELIENYPDMRVWVARNRTINKDIKIVLSKDKDPLVRSAIATKYPLDRELYCQLSKDTNEVVRSDIAYNKKTPLDILKKMSEEDSVEVVRQKAKKNYDKRVEGQA